jgi:hypothetical protein
LLSVCNALLLVLHALEDRLQKCGGCLLVRVRSCRAGGRSSQVLRAPGEVRLGALKEEKAFGLRLPLREKILNFDVPGVEGIVDQLQVTDDG